MSLIHHEKTQITLDTETGLMWQDDIDAKELKLNWLEAQEYCKNLRLGGFTDWEIPNKDILIDLGFKKRELKNISVSNLDAYWSSSSTLINNLYKISVISFQFVEIMDSYKTDINKIKCVRNMKINIFKNCNYKEINGNSIILSSLEKEMYYLKYNNNEYFGFFHEILEKINFSKIESSANISEIINQELGKRIKEYLKVDEIQELKLDLKDKDSFTKDEFETNAEFGKRVNKFINEQTKSYELLQTIHLKEIKEKELEYKNRIENLGDIKKDFLFEIFAQTIGVPVLKDASYDAETNDMYMTLFMSNYFWEKRIKVNIPNRTIAKDFKIKLNEIKVNVTFNLKNEDFVFDKVELEFDNNKFIAEESKEQEKQEEIKIDFKLVTDEKDLETSIDNQLPKYALEVKTLDNQKLEDEIQILKEKIQISEYNNQNNKILNQEIEELKESKLSLENIIKIKENEIISLKNDNRIILIQIENLKQELVSKNFEIEELGKSDLKIHEITSHFENILKIKEDEIISFKNINEQIIKDNQVLNNQLSNKNCQIEELKKYCKELQLNSFKQEQQIPSKVVERESFSDF